VKPLPFAENAPSLAQLVVQSHRAISPGIARLLYDQRELLTNHLCQTDRYQVANLLLRVIEHEGSKGTKVGQLAQLISQVKEAVVTENNPSQAWEKLRDRAIASGLPVEASVSSLPTPPAELPVREQSRAGADQSQNKDTWASWVLPLLRTPEAQTAFLNDVTSHGEKDWFRKLLLTPSLRTPYVEALNSNDAGAREEYLRGARSASNRPSLPEAASIDQEERFLSQYSKIVFIGGQQDPRREADIRELLPPVCDVRFYYADAGASSFRKLTPAALAGEGDTLVVYRPNFTGHSMYYRAVDFAERAGSTLIVLPKGAQNPSVIIDRLSDALRGRIDSESGD
jgi:hypothetical protein